MGKGDTIPWLLRSGVVNSMILKKIHVLQTHFGHYYECMIIIPQDYIM
jgi:hypothetical protein